MLYIGSTVDRATMLAEGPVLDVLSYRRGYGGTVVRVLANWRGRPLVLWVPAEWLQVLP